MRLRLADRDGLGPGSERRRSAADVARLSSGDDAPSWHGLAPVPAGSTAEEDVL
jgi:hypothetical protein